MTESDLTRDVVTSFDVIGGGAASVDQILFVDGVLGDGKGRVDRREVRFGGNIATGLVAAARAGARVAFVGQLPDPSSDLGLLGYLRDEDIDLGHAVTSPGTKPIDSTILVGRDGERFIAFDDDTAVGLPDDLDLDLVRAAKVLLLDEYAVPAGIRAAQAAREAGVDVVVDIEQGRRPRVRELLDLANHLVLPASLALGWTGTASTADAISALWSPTRSAVVVTDGVNGCWYRSAVDADRVHHQPAIIIDVVDSTGCGDVFHGTYAAALARGETVVGAVVAATAAAAECATHPGGIGPRPSTST